MSAVSYIDHRFYSGYGANWDATLFRRHVDTFIRADTSVLDFGAGRGAVDAMNLRRPGRFIAAVDVDRAVLGNPFVNEAKLLEADGRIPYGDEAFDIVVAHNVIEHLPNPGGSFREVHRVLRPGGVFLSKTPNRWHYVPAVARLTPHPFHLWVNRRRGCEEFDTFPTLYRCNTPRTMARTAAQAGFAVESVQLIEGRPEYLRQNVLFYALGLAYERTVNAVPGLSAFRVVMITTLRKPNGRAS